MYLHCKKGSVCEIVAHGCCGVCRALSSRSTKCLFPCFPKPSANLSLAKWRLRSIELLHPWSLPVKHDWGIRLIETNKYGGN